MRVLRLAIATSALLLVSAATPNPAASPETQHLAARAPAGMVAFFTADTCPSGWAAAALAEGRILVGTEDATAVGRTVGTQLAAEEDRVHTHAIDDRTIELPAKNIAAANGGNNSGAASGSQPVAGTASAAPSGQPLVQLLACVRQ